MWKLKLDENGNAVLKDGKPVYVNDSGEEKVFCADTSASKIAQLCGEAKAHREAKQAAEEKLKAFDGIDAEKAREAIELVGDKDVSSMIDKGEVDKAKAEMGKTYQAKIDEAEKETQTIKQQWFDEKIGGAFARSAFIAEKTTMPESVAQSHFGKNFSIKDGKVIATDNNGNEIMSRDLEFAGEPAGFEEALSILVNSSPDKDRLLKSSGMSGSGEQASQGGSQKIASLSECKTEQDKINYLKNLGE